MTREMCWLLFSVFLCATICFSVWNVTRMYLILEGKIQPKSNLPVARVVK